MNSSAFFSTPASPAEAIEIQRLMRDQVRITDEFEDIKTVAGIDVGYDINNGTSRAALVLINIQTLAIQDSITALDDTPFPYIPGLLSFREAPVICKALMQLKETPDILMIDGHGIAHPRGLGIAAHIGVLTGLPAIGVAKSILCGRYEELALEKGSRQPLLYKGNLIGTVYRSRARVKPIIISPGHRVSHESAVALVERCLTQFRLPEPTRLADKLSKIPRPSLL